MKKNKPVQVEIKELNGYDELSIGKKIIATVTKVNDQKYQVKDSDGNNLGLFKTIEDSYEEALKNWNLHN